MLITTGDLYTGCLHGISEVEVDENLEKTEIVNWELLGDNAPFIGGQVSRDVRVSLTFRDVNKVRKLGKALGALARK